MPGRTRSKLNVTIDPESRERLIQLAERRGQHPARVLDAIINEAFDTEDNYMLKQAALQSFVASALAIATANQVLGREAADKVRREAAGVAVRLFGRPPTKRHNIQEGPEGDPRIDALFKAFEGG